MKRSTDHIERKTRRRGWCPTARRPMWAADGALLRLRIAEARISGDALARLATIAERFATKGVLLTRRAKFELRGVIDVDGAVSALDAAGWLETDDMASLPDIVVSPDPRGQGGALARAIRGALIDAGRPRLADKFLIVIDAGSTTGLADLDADVRLDAIDEKRWRLALAGDCATAMSLGVFADSALPERVAGLVAAFVARRRSEHSRVRDLLPPDRQSLIDKFRRASSVEDRGLSARLPVELGYDPALGHVMGFAFGHLSPAALRALAAVAGPAGVGLCPNRRVIVDHLSAAQAAWLVACGAMIDPRDPRATIAACVGKPGCVQASTNTRADALAIAERWPDLARRGLHVSGCAKGCAHRRAAPVALIGRDGGYDVIVNGAPNDTPRWRGLDIETAAAHLAADGND